MCRSHNRFTLDLPRVCWAYLFFRESSRREGGLTACRMANISIVTLRCSVIPTQGCPYLGISRLFFREKVDHVHYGASLTRTYPYYIAFNNGMSKEMWLLAISY